MAQINLVLRRPNFEGIEDPLAREALQYLYEASLSAPFLRSNFQFFTVTYTVAVAQQRLYHRMGFIPKDIIQTSILDTDGGGPYTSTYHYELFTADYVVITTTGPCVIRLFAGAYQDV
jgi:hypothetical protein